MKKDDEKARRLAEALRANLRRRKEQARGQDTEVEAEVETRSDPPPSA